MALIVGLLLTTLAVLGGLRLARQGSQPRELCFWGSICLLLTALCCWRAAGGDLSLGTALMIWLGNMLN